MSPGARSILETCYKKALDCPISPLGCNLQTARKKKSGVISTLIYCLLFHWLKNFKNRIGRMTKLMRIDAAQLLKHLTTGYKRSVFC